MAIPCPGCGREYDISLFAFGRKIHCTCGERVGVEPRVATVDQEDQPPRFLADAMLGRLARWLRLIGYDTAYDAQAEDADLARRAWLERRILLTRDRGLLDAWSLPRSLLVDSDQPSEQLRQVVRAYDLDWRSGLFTRCSLCGGELEGAPGEQVEGSVPPRVRRQQRSFRYCVDCGKVYWRGSHTERFRRTLQRVLEGSGG